VASHPEGGKKAVVKTKMVSNIPINVAKFEIPVATAFYDPVVNLVAFYRTRWILSLN
jgi:hypothetical protein